MNNQEAKQTILEADSCFCKHGAYKDCHSGCKYREALDAAVKALEQEPILDRVRADVEQTRKMYLDMNDIDWLNGCDYVLSVIDKYKAETEAEDGNVD